MASKLAFRLLLRWREKLRYFGGPAALQDSLNALRVERLHHIAVKRQPLVDVLDLADIVLNCRRALLFCSLRQLWRFIGRALSTAGHHAAVRGRSVRLRRSHHRGSVRRQDGRHRQAVIRLLRRFFNFVFEDESLLVETALNLLVLPAELLILLESAHVGLELFFASCVLRVDVSDLMLKVSHEG